MCGRFTQQRPTAEIAAIFAATPLAEDGGERFNVAPTQRVSVVVERDDGRAVDLFRWGLVPAWAKDPRVGSRMINARAETVASSPAFRGALRRHRCIVPADAFYEWRRGPSGAGQVAAGQAASGHVGAGHAASGPVRAGSATRRQPFAIHRRDGAPLAFAGLWSAWRDPRVPEPLLTCTIVTTTPNELMASIHDRMPVILPPDAWDRWLDPAPADPAEFQRLLVPCPAEWLEAIPVGSLVNSVRNQGPALVAATGPAIRV